MQTQISRSATLSAALAGVAIAALLVGAAGAQFEILPTFASFMIFFLGLLLGVVAFALGAIGLLRTRPRSGRAGRSLAGFGFVIGGSITILAVGLAVPGDGERPPTINDITTDREDPPTFVAAVDAAQNRGQDLSYPAQAFASIQEAHYPDLQPIVVSLSAQDARGEAKAVATGLGWEITWEDPSALRFEATDTTAFFHFVDDVAVRVRPQPVGSIIDLRSRSRMGKGDLGANAKRVRSFRKAIGAAQSGGG